MSQWFNKLKLYTPSCPDVYSNNLVCSSGASALAAPSSYAVRASTPFSMSTSLEDLFVIFIYFYVLFSALIDHSIISPYGSITFPKYKKQASYFMEALQDEKIIITCYSLYRLTVHLYTFLVLQFIDEIFEESR